MSEIYFSVTEKLGEKPLPKCEYYEYTDKYFNTGIIRIDDPELEERLKILKKSHFVEKRESSIHYFSDVGFPQCTVCGWTP